MGTDESRGAVAAIEALIAARHEQLEVVDVELASVEERQAALAARRATLAAEVEGLEAALAHVRRVLPAAAPPPARRNGRHHPDVQDSARQPLPTPQDLLPAVAAVLDAATEPLTVEQVARRVVAAGYRCAFPKRLLYSKTYSTLKRNPDRFVQVGNTGRRQRGLWAMAGSGLLVEDPDDETT